MNYELISIILPVHNQAEHIEIVVEEYEKVMEKIPVPHELLLVLNACRDNSLEVCNNLASRYTSIRVINEKKGGWGYAVKSGLAHAQGDLICYTNSARTTPQDLLLLLLYGIANHD